MAEREGDFKPLFKPISKDEKEEKKEKTENKEDLKALLEDIRKENSLLREEIVKLNEEKSKLVSEINTLKELLQKERKERDRLLEQIERIKTEKEDVVKLCKNLQFQLEEVFKEFKEKSAEFIVRVLEEFSFSLPQTEALKEDLDKIFSELINYKLPIKLYMNPKDYRTLESYILSLKEKLRREGLEIQVVTDDKLSVGEVHIKSEQFHIERSPKEFAKAVFEEVFRHVFKGH